MLDWSLLFSRYPSICQLQMTTSTILTSFSLNCLCTSVSISSSVSQQYNPFLVWFSLQHDSFHGIRVSAPEASSTKTVESWPRGLRSRTCRKGGYCTSQIPGWHKRRYSACLVSHARLNSMSSPLMAKRERLTVRSIVCWITRTMRKSNPLQPQFMCWCAKVGCVWLAFSIFDHPWPSLGDFDIQCRTTRRYHSVSTPFSGEKHLFRMQCTDGNLNYSVVLEHQIGSQSLALSSWTCLTSVLRSTPLYSFHRIYQRFRLLQVRHYQSRFSISDDWMESDLGFHLFPTLFMVVDLLMLSPPWTITAIPAMVLSHCIAFGYWFWVEKCYENNGWYNVSLHIVSFH